MKALVIKELGKPGKAEVVDVPEPAVRPTYIKVKATAFALNPSKIALALIDGRKQI